MTGNRDGNDLDHDQGLGGSGPSGPAPRQPAGFPATRPCPYCAKLVAAQDDVCPYCHSFISFADTTDRPTAWQRLAAFLLVLCLLAVVLACLVPRLAGWLRTW